jgi:hypothetical protein
MASEAARRAAGAQGAGISDETPELTHETKARPGKKTRTAAQQETALKAPEVLTFKTTRGELHVPTVFTIGDLVNKRVLDDLNAFVFLVVTEANKVSGAGIRFDQPALLFATALQPYFVVALRTSNVVEFLNTRLILQVGKLFGEDGEQIPLTLADVHSLEPVREGGDLVDATLKIGIHFVARWVEAHRKNA